MTFEPLVSVAAYARDVFLRSDSELLVRQINGQYQIKAPRLQELHEKARQIILGFRRFEVRHVPRAENAAADEQANLAIDEAVRQGKARPSNDARWS